MINVGDNDRNNQIDHDNGAQDDEPNQENHGYNSGHHGVWAFRVAPQIIKFKLSKNHDKYLKEWPANIVKRFCFIPKMDDEESKSKSTNKNEKAQSGFYDPLGDGVVHDAETAPLKKNI